MAIKLCFYFAGEDDTMEPPCELTIIIVNTNTRDLTCRCLESIYANAPGCEFEIIVVDNGSTDGSCDVIDSLYPRVGLIRNGSNLGFSVANNRGLAMARGKYLLLLNSDTIVLPGSLDSLLDAMDRDRSLGVVAPKLIYPDGSLQMSFGPLPNLFVAFCTFFDVKRFLAPSFRRKIGRSGFLRIVGQSAKAYLSWFSGNTPQTRFIDNKTYVTGACILIRRKCYEEVGGLDPAFFMYVDDADYSLRIHQQGWKILYLADAAIVHIKGGTVGERYRWTSAPAYQSMLYFLKKHRGGGAFLVSKIFAITAVFGRWLASIISNPRERQHRWQLLTELLTYHAEVQAE